MDRVRHTMGAAEISKFLTWLAVERHVSASTQNQALSALLFLYKDVLGLEVGRLDQVPRARLPIRVPVVLSREEVSSVLKQLTGHRLRSASDRRAPWQGSEGRADDAACVGQGSAASPLGEGEAPARARSRARGGTRRPAVRTRSQVSERLNGLGLAVCLSRGADLP
jgi:hypothetical protein